MVNGRMLLLIADIAGYTRFMTVHRINLTHAQVIVAELLEAVIDAATPTFKLSKLEGDAAFFYAPLQEGAPLDDVSRTVADIRRAFLACRDRMAAEQLCTCDPCTQAGQLKLKFAAHAGEVALQRVKRLTELAGIAVIVVHRMLKNHVPVPEYVLVTEELHAALPESVRRFAHATHEELEGIGEVTMHYVDLDEIAAELPHELAPQAPLWRRLARWLRLTLRSLPFFVGAKEPCAVFQNLDEARGGSSLSVPRGRP